MIGRALNGLAGDDLLSRLARGGFAALLIKVAAAGLSFLMFLFVARAVGAEDYGRFGFGFSLAMFLSVVASLGLHTGILRWWPEYGARNEAGEAARIAVLGGIWTGLTALGVTVALVLVVPAFAGSGSEGPGYLYAAALLILPLALAEYMASTLRAQGSVILALGAKDVAWRLAIILVAMWAILSGAALPVPGLFAFSAATLALLVLVQIARFYQAMPRGGAGAAAPASRRALLLTTFPMWGAAVLYSISQHVDVLLLGLFISPGQVGPYFAAAKIANLMGLILVAANMVVAPVISRLFHSGELGQLQRVLRTVSLGVAIPTLAGFALIAAAGTQLLEFFGTGFSEAFVPLLVLSAGFGFNALCGPTGYVLQMTGQERGYVRIMAVTYTASFVTQLVLIPLLGTLGAAIGTCLGLVVWNLWARRMAMQRLNLDPTIFAWGRKG